MKGIAARAISARAVPAVGALLLFRHKVLRQATLDRLL